MIQYARADGKVVWVDPDNQDNEDQYDLCQVCQHNTGIPATHCPTLRTLAMLNIAKGVTPVIWECQYFLE